MKKITFFFAVLVVNLFSPQAYSKYSKSLEFIGNATPLPASIIRKMKKYSWREGCPIPLQNLAYIKVSHWGFDGKIHHGALITHKEVAKETIDIFRDLFDQKFPIHKIKLVDKYKGSDDASMAANNTSAFNCRPVTGKANVYSEHSYGKAIDINTVQNPYIKGATVLPLAGKAFADRGQPKPGMIVADGAVVAAFAKRGWEWGGNWKKLKDYQHFEKPRH